MSPDPSAIFARIKSLYRQPLYLRLFTYIRLGHAGYDLVEARLPRQGRILDVGCGYGLFANFLALSSPDRTVFGVELSPRKLQYADQGLPGVSFRRENILECEGGRSYAGIALLHVLHHLASYGEQERLLRRCAEWLAPEGTLAILEVEDGPWWWWKYLLVWLVDHLLYPGDSIFYRGRAGWVALLESLDLTVETVPMNDGRPFPHILYVCRKKA